VLRELYKRSSVITGKQRRLTGTALVVVVLDCYGAAGRRVAADRSSLIHSAPTGCALEGRCSIAMSRCTRCSLLHASLQSECRSCRRLEILAADAAAAAAADDDSDDNDDG